MNVNAAGTSSAGSASTTGTDEADSTQSPIVHATATIHCPNSRNCEHDDENRSSPLSSLDSHGSGSQAGASGSAIVDRNPGSTCPGMLCDARSRDTASSVHEPSSTLTLPQVSVASSCVEEDPLLKRKAQNRRREELRKKRRLEKITIDTGSRCLMSNGEFREVGESSVVLDTNAAESPDASHVVHGLAAVTYDDDAKNESGKIHADDDNAHGVCDFSPSNRVANMTDPAPKRRRLTCKTSPNVWLS